MDTLFWIKVGIGFISDVLSNIVFWAALGLVTNVFILRKARVKFLIFFGTNKNKHYTVFLSNLWDPSSTVEEDVENAKIISGFEFQITKMMGNLFGTSSYSLPEVVQGFVDSFWVGKNIKLFLKVSPVKKEKVSKATFSNSMIIVGSTIKNSLRRYMLENNMLKVIIDGEHSSEPQDINKNNLHPEFTVLSGHEKGKIPKKDDCSRIGLIEKHVYNDEEEIVIFLCVGIDGKATLATVEYLVNNWRDLNRRHKNNSFSRLLWFPECDNSECLEARPTRIRDLVN
ncbi:MAG: hypothetical protein JXB48_06005 [Candidatus Latescibacteria bacterium]|nr:hypothetical protein [Candidatus Latescibacterota bacterium]